MYKNVQGCINMFVESEVDKETDFVPKAEWKDDFWRFCLKYCKNAEHCPEFYMCPTMARWDNADLDDDNSDF